MHQRSNQVQQKYKASDHTLVCYKRGTKNIKVGDGKIISACLIRDLFGSILFLSLERKVDMAQVLSYPLTLWSLSLSHVDGTMLKTKNLL